jgi:hypothetical protein
MSETHIDMPGIIRLLKDSKNEWIATNTHIYFSGRSWSNEDVLAFVKENNLQDKVIFEPSEDPWVAPAIRLK